MEAFTNIRDLDLSILHSLPDYGLYKACQTNQSIYHLCKTDPVLKDRLMVYKRLKHKLLTGLLDVDIEILDKLSNDDLASMCMVDEYSKELCQSTHFLKERLEDYYSIVDEVNQLLKSDHLSFTFIPKDYTNYNLFLIYDDYNNRLLTNFLNHKVYPFFVNVNILNQEVYWEITYSNNHGLISFEVSKGVLKKFLFNLVDKGFNIYVMDNADLY